MKIIHAFLLSVRHGDAYLQVDGLAAARIVAASPEYIASMFSLACFASDHADVALRAYGQRVIGLGFLGEGHRRGGFSLSLGILSPLEI